MSAQIIRLIIAGVLFLHGVAHFGPLGTYIWIRFRPADSTGGWVGARSWLLPSLPPGVATAIASLFWILSIIGFVGAALSFWGVLVPGDLWRQIAIASAIASTLGIVVFFGTWPMFNTIAALGVNLAVLVTQLWLRWPPQLMFGK
jgi:hypothetical protein